MKEQIRDMEGKNFKPNIQLKGDPRTSLVVQQLRLYPSTAGGTSSIPAWGPKIPLDVWCSQKINQLKKIKGVPERKHKENMRKEIIKKIIAKNLPDMNPQRNIINFKQHM